MTKIKVSIKESEETKPRVAVLDTDTNSLHISNGKEISTEKIVKVFPKQGDKK